MFANGIVRSPHRADSALQTVRDSPMSGRGRLRCAGEFLKSGILCGIFAASVLHAADFSSYRGLQFGMDLAAAAAQAGTKVADVRVEHQRPALIQDLDWRPRPVVASNKPGETANADTVKADPVKDGVLSFFNGELFRIVVNYDRYRIEGMTAEDMIQGISATYGTPSKPGVEIPYHSNYGEAAAVIARWEDAENSVNLVRTGDRSSFSLVLYSKRLDTLAQTAIVQAVRLEAQEAPQREIERQKKRADDESLLLEKARLTNKPNFQP